MEPRYVDRHPFFSGHGLPDPQDMFVCWMDAMGIQSAMNRSLIQAGNFIFKLHIAALEAPRALRLYPVMDGVYVVGRKLRDIQLFLKDVLSRLADMFVCEEEQLHRFVVRAGVAHGPVLHGDSLPKGICDTLDLNTAQRDAIILGEAVVNAYLAERQAPPFGVTVHESVHGVETVTVGEGQAWRWHVDGWRELGADLRFAIDGYLDWRLENPGDPPYDAERIEEHRRWMAEYLDGAA